VHRSVLEWVPTVLLGREIVGAHILEVGSHDVNGTVRPLIEAHGPASYRGVDRTPGPNVDRVVPVDRLVEWFGEDRFDIVISTEMLEHVDDWRTAMTQMASVTRPGGSLVVTTRSRGFPFHPFPVDNWRFSAGLLAEAMETVGCDVVELYDDPQFPGMFCKARRTGPIGSLDHLEAELAPCV